MIDVIDPGPLTTIQDAGRPRLSHLGIAVGGAADPLAYAFANRLVGNQSSEAALEMTLKGGKFRFVEDTVFALTGADLRSKLDGVDVPLWRSVQARAGQELHCGVSAGGARAYLAVRGGFDDKTVMGSRSVLIAAGLGQKLRKDERLRCARSEGGEGRYVIEPPSFDGEISVLPGPAWSEALLGEFTVTDHANRSGIRLQGPSIVPPRAGESTSEGVIWGTIQAPGSGQLVILMNEQATTGGYPVVAWVIAADRYRLAQLRPREAITFRRTDIARARAALREQQLWITRGTRD